MVHFPKRSIFLYSFWPASALLYFLPEISRTINCYSQILEVSYYFSGLMFILGFNHFIMVQAPIKKNFATFHCFVFVSIHHKNITEVWTDVKIHLICVFVHLGKTLYLFFAYKSEATYPLMQHTQDCMIRKLHCWLSIWILVAPLSFGGNY